jgi:hypothetical protein
MGGDLRVKSAEDRGSCFYFQLELPADPAEAKQLAPAEAEGGCPGFDAAASQEQVESTPAEAVARV